MVRAIGWTSGNAIAGGYYSQVNFDYLTTLAYAALQPVSSTNPALVMRNGPWSHLSTIVTDAHSRGKRAAFSIYDDISRGGCFNAFVNNGLLAQFAANVAQKAQQYGFDEVEIDHEDWTEPGPTFPMRKAVVDAIYAALNPIGVEVVYYSAALPIPGSFASKIGWMEVNTNPSVRPPTEDSAFNDTVNATLQLYNLGWPKEKLGMVIRTWADYMDPVKNWPSTACAISDVFAAGLDLHPSSGNITEIDSVFWGPNWSVPGGKLYWDGINLIKRKTDWMKANGYSTLTYFTSDNDTIPNNDPHSLLRNAWEGMSGAPPPPPDGFPAGSPKTATVTVKVTPGGVPMSGEVWLGPNPTTKVATSGKVPFTSTGNNQNVNCPVTMPSTPGTYHVYMDLYQGTVLVGTYVANQDVVVTGGTTYLYHVAVTITPAGAGSVTLTPGGTVSGAGGLIGYDVNQQVVASYTNAPGHAFSYYMLDGTNQGTMLAFTSGDRNLEAVFS